MTNQTIHLQGIGKVNATPAGEITAGDSLVFNYGHSYTVKGIGRKTAKTVNVILVNKAGDEFVKRFFKTTLVALRKGR